MKKKWFAGMLAAVLAFSGLAGPERQTSLAADTAHGEMKVTTGGTFSFVQVENKVWGFGNRYATSIYWPTDSIYGHTKPAEVISPENIKMARGGYAFSLYVKTDGSVWGVGNNEYGQIGQTPSDDPIREMVQIPGLSDIREVAGGYYHSLALTNSGTVYAWGKNDEGELGNPNPAANQNPHQVAGLSDVKSVAAGYGFSLALKQDGTVWAWGDNGNYTLGNNSNVDSQTPVQVLNLTGIKQISARHRHAMALTEDGKVYVWGYSAMGQAGNNTNKAYVMVPAQSMIDNVTDISAGEYFSLALKSDGTVWSWGSNEDGRLGVSQSTGTLLKSLLPVHVSSLSSIVDLEAGDRHGIALKQDGTVYTWGANHNGQLGDGSTWDERLAPVPTVNLRELTVFAAFINPTTVTLSYDLHDFFDPSVHPAIKYKVTRNNIVLTNCSQTSCLDSGLVSNTVYKYTVEALNAFDVLLAAKTITLRTPLKAATELTSGDYHTMLLKEDGTLTGWGFNEYGQLGDGTLLNRLTPVPILSDVTDVVAGYRSSYARKSDGKLYAWGDNKDGQLGLGDKTGRTSPELIPNLTNVAAFDSKGYHAVALTKDGTVWSWGRNTYGALATGDDTERLSPVSVPVTNVSDVKAGFDHTLFLKKDGTVWAAGRNDVGQLGNQTFTNSNTPVQVKNLSNIIAIVAGPLHSVALKNDGTVWTWGYNVSGQLGDGTFTNRSEARQVPNLKNIKAIDSGRGHVVALAIDGTVWSWGYNTKGQLGNSQRTDSPVPVHVPGVTDVVQVTAGGEHTVVRQTSGKLLAFGSNTYGELGDGTNTYSTTPVETGGTVSLSLYAVSTAPTSMQVSSKASHSSVAKRVLRRNGAMICQGTCDSYTDGGLLTATPYTYRAEAYDAANNLVASKTIVEATLASGSGTDGFEDQYFEEDFYPLW